MQSDIPLLNIFENFHSKCTEIYKPDPAYFLLASGLAWQAYLMNTGVELEFLTVVDVPLMVEKGTKGGTCCLIHWHTKASNKYVKDYNRNKELSHLMY